MSRAKDLQEKNDELCGELRKLDKAVKTLEDNSSKENAVLRKQLREMQV